MLPVIGGVVVILLMFGGAATLINAIIENRQQNG